MSSSGLVVSHRAVCCRTSGATHLHSLLVVTQLGSLAHGSAGVSPCGLQGFSHALAPAYSPQCATCRWTEALPTQAFLAAMEEDDEIEVELSPNQNVIIKFKAVGELQPNGTREVSSGSGQFEELSCAGEDHAHVPLS